MWFADSIPAFRFKDGLKFFKFSRNLNKAFDKIELRSDKEAANAIADYLRENDISTDGTSHRKMLAIDTLVGKFGRKLLCKTIDIEPDSFDKHRRNLTHGPNSYQRREEEIEKRISAFLSGWKAINGNNPIPKPFRLCKQLKLQGIVTRPQLIKRIVTVLRYAIQYDIMCHIKKRGDL